MLSQEKTFRTLIIRLWLEGVGADQRFWRGIIIDSQSGDEIHFQTLEVLFEQMIRLLLKDGLND